MIPGRINGQRSKGFKILSNPLRHKASRLLPLRELCEGPLEGRNLGHRRGKEEHLISRPLAVAIRFMIHSLKGVHPQVENLWHAQLHVGILPDFKSVRPLFPEDQLDVPVTDCDNVSSVGGIDKLVARAGLGLVQEMR